MGALLKCTRFLRLSSAYVQSSRNVSSTSKGIVIGVYGTENQDDVELTPAGKKYNKLTDGKLCEALKFVEGKLKEGKTYLFWGLEPNHQAVALVGLGSKSKGYDELERINEGREAVRRAAAAGCKTLQEAGIKSIFVDTCGDAEAAAEGSTLGLFKFQECKSKPECPSKINLLSLSKCDSPTDQVLWSTGVIKANAQNDARWLTDMPSNLMTPEIFAKHVEKTFAAGDVCVAIYDKQWMQKKSMNAFLAVAKGSCEPPKFIEITYSKGCPSDPPCILVGKGITFDSGGISIKPSRSMDEMRGDMGGAAACVAALKAVSLLDVPINLKVLVPLCENMPSSTATKPGDIVKAMNGKSIGINNTDAEGRLILADALSYGTTFNPKWIMTVATLTGAMRVALGNAAAGVFTNSDNLYNSLEKAGCKTGDRVWRFPLWKQFKEEITKQPAYDVNNIGKGVGGGSCTAAAFLKEFVTEKMAFIHMDIAGVMGPTSEIPYLAKGMTGRPTRTLVEFIELQSKIC